jgi:hypothetical protein
MNYKFDELAKGLAQSVTKRQTFKKFGVGLAGMALACFGLANRAETAGALACCTYKCIAPTQNGKPKNLKFCGPFCQPPFGEICTFMSSHSVTDCTNC